MQEIECFQFDHKVIIRKLLMIIIIDNNKSNIKTHVKW